MTNVIQVLVGIFVYGMILIISKEEMVQKLITRVLRRCANE